MSIVESAVRYSIPFNRPYFFSRELSYVKNAVSRGKISGDGYYTLECQRLLEEKLKVPKVLLTTSCTHALELAALLLDLSPGDEIIVPSFTFVSSVNAFVLRGARPVFADIRPDTLNINEELLPSLFTPRTKAVVVVHYAGVSCEMDTILDLCNARNIAVIEDNAHGLFGAYKDRPLGSMGIMSTQSYHETKNITCGEGGSLNIVSTEFISRAEIIREKGTNRSKFFRGEVDKYTWMDVGSSFLPSDILAAILYSQLKNSGDIQAKRRYIWDRYNQELGIWAAEQGVTLPVVPTNCKQAYHMFYMLMPDLESRKGLIQHLAAQRISAVFHYVPLHSSPMGVKLGGLSSPCPVSQDVSERIVRLPLFYDLSDDKQSHVIDSVKAYCL